MVPLAVLSLTAVVLGGSPRWQPSPRPESLRHHLGFAFSPGTCEQGAGFCAATRPRDWTAAEVELVRGALDEIAASDAGRCITARALHNGFRTLRRYTQAAQASAGSEYEIEATIAATAHVDDRLAVRTIDLTDKFFDRRSARDHFSGEPGYLLTTEILVHELTHAMDLNARYSGTDEFRKIARLGTTAANQRVADRVNLDRERLNAAGRYEESWQASRSFGLVTLGGRLPTVQSLDNYREAFAEFGAHLVLDPHVRKRLEPRVLRYLDRALADTPNQ